MSKKLYVIREYLVLSKVDFNDENYPDMTLEEAIRYEKEDPERNYKVLENAVSDGSYGLNIIVTIINEDNS